MLANLKKHIPLIKFLGPRHLLKKTEQKGTQSIITDAVNTVRVTNTSASASGNSAFKLKKLPLSEKEIEAVMLGGAKT